MILIQSAHYGLAYNLTFYFQLQICIKAVFPDGCVIEIGGHDRPLQTLSWKSCCHMAKADLLMSFWPHCSPAKSAMQIACLRLPRNCSVFRQDRRSCSVLSHNVISACKPPSV